MTNRWNLKGKKALVTGGSKGIGKETVKELLNLGTKVVFVARDPLAVDETINEMKKISKDVYGIVGDVSIKSDRENLFEKVEELIGGLDILVNNVGTNIRKKSNEYSPNEIEAILNTNLKSTFDMCRMAFPLLKENGGSIINMSSVAGLTHIKTGSPYGMTKAALVQLTKNLAVEWAEHDIRVNCIAPWYINTPLVEPVLKKEDYFEEVISRTPMRRIGSAEEVSGTIAFLAMEPSSYITGQCIAIDGGFLSNGF